MNTKYLEIIKAPVITEKSSTLAQNEGKYIFKVDPKANKTEIKELEWRIFYNFSVKQKSLNQK